MRYDESVIEQVREANDIVDVVGQYVRLTKKGANYFGLCPFHGEKTASFSVSPRKQIYYCFGCGAGGNVINFLMEYENYSFTESLKSLADRAHIELPEPTGQSEDRRGKERRKQLLDIHKDAAVFYYKQLQTPEGAPGYQYFRQKRRLSDATITHFGLGFAPKATDALYRYLKEKGWGDELLQASGLVTIRERGIRDKFWNRVMFPIMDTNNHVIAFGGRVMGDGIPKYLNSPETEIFDKSAHLYGMNFARKSRRKFMLICEGYMDVIALHQAGFTNAVASLGTAFNEKHARLLKRYTDTVIMTQDSDEAGTNAKIRAFPILYEAGLKVKVLDMGKYKDPDEFIRAEGPDAYEACILKAENAFLFMIGVLQRSYDLSDPAEKTAFYTETAERLCMFKEPLERENYIDSVSTKFLIPRDMLKELVDRRVELKGAGIDTVQSLKSYTPPALARKERQQRESMQLAESTGIHETPYYDYDDSYENSYYPADASTGSTDMPAGNLPGSTGSQSDANGSGSIARDDISYTNMEGFAPEDIHEGFDLNDTLPEGFDDSLMPEGFDSTFPEGFGYDEDGSGGSAVPDQRDPGSGRPYRQDSAAGQKEVPGGRGSSFDRQKQVGDQISSMPGGPKSAAPGISNASARPRGRDPKDAQMNVIRSERLLTAWLCERPDLGRYVFAQVSPEDFSSAICREILKTIRSDPGKFDAASFLDRCGEDEAKRKAAAAVFAILDSSNPLESMSRMDLEKGLTEAVRAVLNSRFDREIQACGSDMARLGSLLREKSKVRNVQIRIP